MRQRMSRNHKRRKEFKINNFLDMMLEKNRNEVQPHPVGDYMTLTFLGFHDHTLEEDGGFQIKVDTSLLKISHKKRKDSSSAIAEISVSSLEHV